MNMRTLLPTLWDRDEKTPAGLGHFRKELEKLFDDFSKGFPLPEAFSKNEGFDLAPDMDIQDTGKEVKLSLELPGVEEKDIDISVSGQAITISGEKKSETETKSAGMYRSERSYGSFCRSMSLPFSIDSGKVEAKLQKGVLSVTIAKPAEVVEQTMKIAVKA